MRTLLMIVVLAIGAPALAQSSAEPQCLPLNHLGQVVVTTADGTIRRGSLLCLGVGELVLAERTAVERFRLDEVRHVRKAADPVWDGALKGAAFGLLPLLFGCPAECVLRSVAAYGLLGSALDAIDTHTDTIYESRDTKRASVGVRVRF